MPIPGKAFALQRNACKSFFDAEYWILIPGFSF